MPLPGSSSAAAIRFDCGASADQTLIESLGVWKRAWRIDSDLRHLALDRQGRILNSRPTCSMTAWLTTLDQPAPAYVFARRGEAPAATGRAAHAPRPARPARPALSAPRRGLSGVGVAVLDPLRLNDVHLFKGNRQETEIGCCFREPWAVIGTGRDTLTEGSLPSSATGLFTRVHVTFNRPLLPRDLRATYRPPGDVSMELRPLGALVSTALLAAVLWGAPNGDPVVWEALHDLSHLDGPRRWAGGSLVRADGSSCVVGLDRGQVTALGLVLQSQLSDRLHGM
jgi:hypothetical protein